MSNTFTMTGFIWVVVFLGLLTVATIVGCVAYFINEWRQLKFARPACGPSKPPYPRAFKETRDSVTAPTPVSETRDYTNMDTILIGLIVTISIIFVTGVSTLLVLGYFKWKEYKQHRDDNRTRRRPGGSRQPSRRRHRHIRVRNAVTPQTLNNSVQILLQPPPYSAIDGDAPPPYTPYGVLEPPRRNSISTRPSPCLTPRPLQDVDENSQEPQQFSSNRRFSHLTGSTNTPMVTPAGSMFTTSIGGTRNTSASSNMRSVNMVHIENNETYNYG